MIKTLFLPTYQRQNFYIEDFVYILVICEARSVRSSVGFKISARVRQSSVTSNTLWASVIFFGQITVQRYVVFVSTVELRTLYIQELPHMNTFCECILKKIGPTHAHFKYNARKLLSLKSVLILITTVLSFTNSLSRTSLYFSLKTSFVYSNLFSLAKTVTIRCYIQTSKRLRSPLSACKKARATV